MISPNVEHPPVSDEAGSAVAHRVTRHASAQRRQCDACRSAR